MKKRIFTGIGIVLTLALLFVLKISVPDVGDYFFDAFFAVVACIAAFEMARLLSKMGKYNFKYAAIGFPVLLLASNLLGIHYANVNSDLYWILWTILIDIALMIVMAFGLYLFGLLRRKATLNEMKVRDVRTMSVARFSFLKAMNTLVTFVYPSFLFLMFLFINHLHQLPLDKVLNLKETNIDLQPVSVFMVVTALIIPMITDTFAMLMGSLIGGKKLCPKISPNKTISGSVGGILWCVLISACVYIVFGCISAYAPFIEAFPIWAFLLIVFFGSIIAQAGDLFESIVKRKAQVSDSGNILPGHGGMLDRIDSYIYIAPYVLLAFLVFAL